MSGIDEEEEILLSIFPEEFEKLNASTFKVRVDIDASESKIQSPPTVFLVAHLPSEYPEVGPILHLESIPSEAGEDLTGEDRDALLSKLDLLIEENLGIAMIFTLVSALKEEVILLLDDRINKIESAKAAAAAEVEKREQKRFEGTKVTRESFNAWNANFKIEMARKRQEEEEATKKQLMRAGAAFERKLTGRQLFEGDTTLAESDLKIGEATDVEFDFSKFDKTTRNQNDETTEDETSHWAAV